MCLAIPAKIIRVMGDNAKVDIGGIKKVVSLALLEEKISPDDYVIIHTGFAIQKIDQSMARESLSLLKEGFSAISR